MRLYVLFPELGELGCQEAPVSGTCGGAENTNGDRNVRVAPPRITSPHTMRDTVVIISSFAKR